MAYEPLNRLGQPEATDTVRHWVPPVDDGSEYSGMRFGFVGITLDRAFFGTRMHKERMHKTLHSMDEVAKCLKYSIIDYGVIKRSPFPEMPSLLAHFVPAWDLEVQVGWQRILLLADKLERSWNEMRCTGRVNEAAWANIAKAITAVRKMQPYVKEGGERVLWEFQELD